MLQPILRNFPPHTHPLTLVHDPDGLLAEEEILTALSERGFRLVNESDPILLHHRVEQARPFSAARPLIVVTGEPLNQLPYDLWQQGQRVDLSLHTFFPNLAYSVIQTLTPTQRWRLSQAQPPPRRLGQQSTIEFVLHHVFAADPDMLREPAALIDWLDAYHQTSDPMPDLIAEHLLGSLTATPAFADWPLRNLLSSREVFADFVGSQWQTYLQRETGELLSEKQTPYLLSFHADDSLQDLVPRLIRHGTLEPVRIETTQKLPGWARAGAFTSDTDYRPRRVAELLELLQEQMASRADETRWKQWQKIIRLWAELTVLRYELAGQCPNHLERLYRHLCRQLDETFLTWLSQRYSLLGAQRLPVPHHVYHIPHYIAYQRRQGRADRIVLLVMDGMALADWYVISRTWRARHGDWRLREQLILAQIPTITSISRQALISGLRPADFEQTLAHNRAERELWSAFWAQEDLARNMCLHLFLNLSTNDMPSELDSPRSRAICLIDNSIDDMLHGVTLGTADLLASLRLWLDEDSKALEGVISRLLTQGFTVYVTSDHGHVEAQGMGTPSEGLIVQTRARRARVYAEMSFAASVQQSFPETILWSEDGLLPDTVHVLLPAARYAFASFGRTVVTHGGPTPEEVVVPFVEITTE